MGDFWEHFIIHTAVSIVHALVRNPKKQQALQAYLLELADTIYMEYGLTPPAQAQAKG